MKKLIIILSLVLLSCKPTATMNNYLKIPVHTKFKVSDKVCAWGRWSGVVLNMRMSYNPPEGHPEVLVYEVRYTTHDENCKCIKFELDEFYDTELEAGDCK